ncbi:MAG: serine/threonine protein kinase [Myxococcales bacterium]|nr:serine/threonine protein kinase [Myxococcales bacterium]
MLETMGEPVLGDDVTVVVSETVAEPLVPIAEASLRAGDRVGRYRLVRRLGSGGMGVVWVAHDPELDRTVAVKVLHERSRRGGSRAHERMRREAVAQARLSHPNVVAIYDVGLHEGRVFLTMEHVEGRTLDEWAARGPALPEVLEVFEQAAAGLAAVHEAGFVHRDFKPSNVMIDREGRVLVMDFGLARLSDPESVSELDAAASSAGWSVEGSNVFATELTCEGVAMGTPAYMAPEQHAGGSADARADQFSFCATLYEVVVGRRPFQGRTIKELAHEKAHGERDFGSARLAVPRALRALIGRGLEPEPVRRHPSMDELRERLGQLRGARSRARPVALAITAALALGGIGWAGLVRVDPDACEAGEQLMTRGWNDERRERLRRSFVDTGLVYAEDAARRAGQRLDAYAERWTAAHQRVCTSAAERSEAAELDPRMACLAQARASMTMTVELLLEADANGVQHAADQVLGLPSLTRCEDLDTLRAELPLPEDAERHAAIEAIQAELEAARALELGGRYDEGLARARAALADARALGHEPTVARALIRLGALELGLGDPESSRQLLTEAALLAAGADDHSAAADAASRLVFVCAEALGRPDEALRWARHAEAALERMPLDPLARARLDGSLGVLYSATGEHARALERFEAAHEAKREVLGAEHPEVAGALENVALSLGELGRPRDAEVLHRRTAAIMEEVLGPEHPDFAFSLMNLGYAVAALGKHDEAIEHYSRALEISRAALGPRHPQVSRALSSLGRAAVDQDRLLEAEGYYREAAEILEAGPGERHHEHAWLIADRAHVMLQMGRNEEALALFRRAREILEAEHGPDHDDVGHVLMSEASSLIELERLDEAEVALDRVGAIFEAQLEPGHPARGAYRANRGELLRARGDREGARAELLEGLAITRAALGPDHPAVASILLSLGEIALDRGQPAEAQEHLREGLRITEAGAVGEGFRAALRFALAKALWDDDATRAEARDLARRARDGFGGYGELFDEDVAEIDAWLEGHRSG